MKETDGVGGGNKRDILTAPPLARGPRFVSEIPEDSRRWRLDLGTLLTRSHCGVRSILFFALPWGLRWNSKDTHSTTLIGAPSPGMRQLPVLLYRWVQQQRAGSEWRQKYPRRSSGISIQRKREWKNYYQLGGSLFALDPKYFGCGTATARHSEINSFSFCSCSHLSASH